VISKLREMWGDSATRYGRGALMAGMALSYAEQYQLALAAGIPHPVAWLYPLSIDMPILAAVEAVQRLAKGKAAVAWLALLAFLGFSMWGNAMHSQVDEDGRLALSSAERATVDAAPPVSVLATHVLVAAMVAARRRQEDKESGEPTAAAADGTPPNDPPAPVGGSGTSEPEPVAGTAATLNTGTGDSASRGTAGSGTADAGTAKPVPETAPAGTAEPSGTEDGEDEAAPRNAKQVMLAYWIDEVRAGREPTGADLDRVAGVSSKSGLGRKRAKAWRDATLPELQAELASGR